MPTNQRLLVSVYDAQETREAILGGGRVIDCEDPAGALGDISPQRVMMIGDAVLGYKRNLDVQISTNIGENQLLFKRDENGRAVQRFPGEIAGKAAQAALGVAAAMDTEVHPVNIVKVGLDGMPESIAYQTLLEVRQTLDRSRLFSHTQVISVFFVQDLKLWKARKSDPEVIRQLLLAREYVVDPAGEIDIQEMFGDNPDAMKALKARLELDPQLYRNGNLIAGVKVKTTQLQPRKDLGFADEPIDYVRQIADMTARAGADGLMIDTVIHSKIAGICCVKDGAESAPLVAGKKLEGIFTVAQLGECAEYCHHKGIEFWVAGSIQPTQAQPLWDLQDAKGSRLIDGIAVRGGASGPDRTPPLKGAPVPKGEATRGAKKIYRDLVEPYAPKS